MPARRLLLQLPLSQDHGCLHKQRCIQWWTGTTEWHECLETNCVSVCNTTMIRLEFEDAGERDCLWITILVLHSVLRSLPAFQKDNAQSHEAGSVYEFFALFRLHCFLVRLFFLSVAYQTGMVGDRRTTGLPASSATKEVP
ncbi:hypothetical protein TNCV_3600021 [Trichonephila clavipes]|nr:hypothetical protein TNCV_3600021 [Trichonephila clavipes]